MDIGHILNGNDEGTWYTVPGCEGKENPAMIRVRPIKPGRQRQLRRQAEKRSRRDASVQRDVDIDTLYSLIRDEFIVDWKNIDDGEKPIPCTAENKLRLDDNWRTFNRFWNELFSDDSVLELELVEADQKN